MEHAQRKIAYPILFLLFAFLTPFRSVTSRRPSCALGFLSALLVLLPLAEQVQAQEQLYERRSLSEWQSDLGDMSPGIRRKAVEALGYFGPPALPYLIRGLKDPDTVVYEVAIKSLSKVGSAAVPALTQVIANNKEGRRVVDGAIRALGNLGPDAKEAVPELARALSNPQFGYAAAGVLTKIGPPAVSALSDALVRGDTMARSLATSALAKIGPAAVPALVRSLKETSADVRRSAAEALENMGPKAKDAVPALTRALNDVSPQVRRWAASAVPALVKVLKDDNAQIRFLATRALGAIGPAASAAIPALAETLPDNQEAFTVLAGFGKAAKDVVPTLVPLLRHRRSLVRMYAAKVLRAIGPEAKAAVPALIENLGNPDLFARSEAIHALGDIGPTAAEAVPALAELMTDKRAGVEHLAGEALGDIGPPAVAALTAKLDHPDYEVRLRAVRSLAKIGPGAKAALPALIRMYREPVTVVRMEAYQAIKKIEGN